MTSNYGTREIDLQRLSYNQSDDPSESAAAASTWDKLEHHNHPDHEYENSLLELKKLADLGIISKEERIRRSQLITKFMHFEIGDEEKRCDDKVTDVVYKIDSLLAIFLNCLRDCFLGRYEVD
jgi:hypothetical protein